MILYPLWWIWRLSNWMIWKCHCNWLWVLDLHYWADRTLWPHDEWPDYDG